MKNYIPQPDDHESVWVTYWINGQIRTGRRCTRGFVRRARLWAIDQKLDLVIEINAKQV
jgi:hypothetical protein